MSSLLVTIKHPVSTVNQKETFKLQKKKNFSPILKKYKSFINYVHALYLLEV